MAEVVSLNFTADREEGFMTEAEKWKLLMASPDEAEVYLLKSRLESEGLVCRVEALSKYPERSHAGRSREFRAYVPVEEFEASLQVFEDDQYDDEEL